MCSDFLRLRAKLYLELTFKIPGKTWNEACKIEWEPWFKYSSKQVVGKTDINEIIPQKIEN